MRHTALYLIISLFLFNCASTPEQLEASHQTKLKRQVDDEIAIGRNMAAKVLGHFGDYKKSTLPSIYVNLVGQLLAQSAGRPELKYYFGILNTKEANAFATPGGYIFITAGLLSQIQSESELAAVLGHEMAHINEKHMYKEIAPEQEVSATGTMVNLMSRGSSSLGASISKVVGAGMKLLLEDGLGKEKEVAADQAGILYSSMLGYDPNALLNLMKRMSRNKGDKNQQKLLQSYAERVPALQKFIADNGFKKTKRVNSQVLHRRFDRALSSIRNTAKTAKK